MANAAKNASAPIGEINGLPLAAPNGEAAPARTETASHREPSAGGRGLACRRVPAKPPELDPR